MEKPPVLQDVGRIEGKQLGAGSQVLPCTQGTGSGLSNRIHPDKDFPLIILLFQIAQTDYSGTEMGRLKIPLIPDCWNLVLGSIWENSGCFGF